MPTLHEIMTACQGTDNSRFFTVGLPTISQNTHLATKTPSIKTSSTDSLSNGPESIHTPPPTDQHSDQNTTDHHDWTGPNSFFAFLHAHRTSIAWLEGEPGALSLCLGSNKNDCNDSRLQYHRTELRKVTAAVNSGYETRQNPSFNDLLEEVRDSYNRDPKHKGTQIRILNTRDGPSPSATIMIGDNERDWWLGIKMYLHAAKNAREGAFLGQGGRAGSRSLHAERDMYSLQD